MPLTFQQLSASIVIPNFNGKHLLKKHLPAVVSAVKGSPIIIVDDASTDDSVAFIQNEYPELVLVRNNKNARFAYSCNQGVLAATTPVVVLLNNDVSPQKDFLNYVMPYFSDPKVFAVGCLEVDDADITSGRSGMKFSRGIFSHWRSSSQISGDTAWVSGGSGAFSRDIWLKLGGMDTLFAPAYEEDRDLSYRALKNGYKVLFEVRAKVSHHHESTNRTALGENFMRIASHKNQLLFIWKNIHSFTLITQHIFYLPYHLLFSSVKTNGRFLIGFLWALAHLPKVLFKRDYGKMPVSDRIILKKLETL